MEHKPRDMTTTPDTSLPRHTGADALRNVPPSSASFAEKDTTEVNDRDLLNQLLGQVQMANALGKLSTTVAVSKMSHVKEHKLYQHMKGLTDHDGRGLSGTWEEFCRLLGTSAPKANEDITNLRTFGEDALDAMSRMGIGYREMRQYRKLPDDQRLALIEAANDGDKTLLIDLAEALIDKHIKEKAALVQDVDDIKTDLTISRQALAEKKERLDQAREDNATLQDALKFRVARETPEAEGGQIVQDISILQHAVVADLIQLERGLALLADHTERTGIIHHSLMAGILNDLETQINGLRQQFHLPDYPPHDPRPDWVRDAEEVHLNQQGHHHD